MVVVLRPSPPPWLLGGAPPSATLRPPGRSSLIRASSDLGDGDKLSSAALLAARLIRGDPGDPGESDDSSNIGDPGDPGNPGDGDDWLRRLMSFISNRIEPILFLFDATACWYCSTFSVWPTLASSEDTMMNSWYALSRCSVSSLASCSSVCSRRSRPRSSSLSSSDPSAAFCSAPPALPLLLPPLPTPLRPSFTRAIPVASAPPVLTSICWRSARSRSCTSCVFNFLISARYRTSIESALVTSFTVATLTTFFARDANWSVESESPRFLVAGEIAQMIPVFALPPKAVERSRVSLESR